jgi:hypothetical protein
MGRHYFGDITGKFWFAIQSSDDVERICDITDTPIYEYHVCGCEVEDHTHLSFCKHCYNTYKEHLTAALEEDAIEDDHEPLYTETSMIRYTLTKEEHLSQITNFIETVKDTPLFSKFTLSIDTKDNYYEYTLERHTTELSTAELITLARFCLASQIAKCFKEQDTCCFDAET